MEGEKRFLGRFILGKGLRGRGVGAADRTGGSGTGAPPGTGAPRAGSTGCFGGLGSSAAPGEGPLLGTAWPCCRHCPGSMQIDSDQWRSIDQPLPCLGGTPGPLPCPPGYPLVPCPALLRLLPPLKGSQGVWGTAAFGKERKKERKQQQQRN